MNRSWCAGTQPGAQLQRALETAEEQGISLSVALFERFILPRSLDDGDAITATQNNGKGVYYFFAATARR